MKNKILVVEYMENDSKESMFRTIDENDHLEDLLIEFKEEIGQNPINYWTEEI